MVSLWARSKQRVYLHGFTIGSRKLGFEALPVDYSELARQVCKFGQMENRFIAYVDESFELRESHIGGRFYLLCCVLVNEATQATQRNKLRDVVGADYWHTTELARSRIGQDEIRRVASWASNLFSSSIWVTPSIEAGDRLGEQARALLIKQMISHLIGNLETETIEIIFERRRPGFQANADKRTIQELRQTNKLARNFPVRFLSPTEGNLLWLPDLICWSYRQVLVGRSPEYFNILVNAATVHLNSKSRLP